MSSLIDIHCHILPGVDDGAKHMEESIAMAKEALEQGVYTIVATPSHMNGKHHNFKKEILKYVKDLNNRLVEEEVPLTVLPGQCIRINGDLLDSFESGHLLEMNVNSGYVMIELPQNHLPQYMSQLIYDLQLKGYRPILVHPEKHAQFIYEPDALYELVKKGLLVQVSTDSVIGKNSRKVQKFVHEMIEANLTHFIGTEAGDRSSYTFQAAVKEIRKKYGNATVYYYLENATLMTKGETVLGDEPIRMKKKKRILGII
ncbi:tyrosine protein phosphatase [Aquibacillus koreensis]|uniref:Tyrosine-protein phosphatase n=1 Tax=Aquibacillus koreensis TaxID=279446 RepID=A0A9X3WM54_9BACI|nr:CpsB/CapC family capsule biosynthesis tyrosine phosphatase [Aquibacillus koreensis]MCT2534625.1 tyrosine protein phosphatase [Aquibacillus koreensis]MDC3419809.1 tyrosine protein phosphatase [Aquibacillus koreensis]